MKLITELSENISPLVESKGDNKNLYIEGIFMQSEIKNRNGRIYPKSVMESAVNRYINDKINQGQSWGELNHPCLTENVEVLTKNSGWKKITELTLNEEVYTLNPITRKIEYNKIEEIHKNHYNGNLLNISNRGFNTTVTPYHKFLTYYRDGSPSWITAKNIKYGIDNNISKLSKFCIPKTGDLDSISPNIININGLIFNYTNFISFLSLYLAEGCTTKRKDRNNSYRIQIFQKEGIKADKIRKLLNSITELKFFEYKNSNGITWNCYNKELGEYLIQFGNCYNKYIDKNILNTLDEKHSNIFLEWYVLGDGRGSLHEKYSQTDVFSTSKQMIDDLSIVAVKSGHAIHQHTYVEHNDIIIENRIIKAENKNPLHFLQLLSSDNIYLDKRHITIKEIPWNDYVYCITTYNSTFLVKENGYCYWSGNCSPKIDPDRVSHLITELRFDGNDVYGKAKIGGPKGDAVKSLLELGGKIAVSSRGLGSLKENRIGIMEVQQDFQLATAADIVLDPSAPSAFVKGIMEGIEWYYKPDNDSWEAEKIRKLEKHVKSLSKRELLEKKFTLFEHYVNTFLK